jgi:uncharacterized Zn finger protein (UPF0148 family)
VRIAEREAKLEALGGQEMARHKVNRVVCPLCGKEFGTSAEHEEHKKIVHNVMDKKTNLGPQTTNPRDLEPADDTPTTELPPGAENTVNQDGSQPSDVGAPGKSKGVGR